MASVATKAAQSGAPGQQPPSAAIKYHQNDSAAAAASNGDDDGTANVASIDNHPIKSPAVLADISNNSRPNTDVVVVYDVEHLATFSTNGSHEPTNNRSKQANSKPRHTTAVAAAAAAAASTTTSSTANANASNSSNPNTSGDADFGGIGNNKASSSSSPLDNAGDATNGTVTTPRVALMRLFELEKLSGIWTQRMQIELRDECMLIVDCETSSVVEKFDKNSVTKPEAFNEYNHIYNNIVVFIIKQPSAAASQQKLLGSSEQTNSNSSSSSNSNDSHEENCDEVAADGELHIFQCVSQQAQQLVADILDWKASKLSLKVRNSSLETTPPVLASNGLAEAMAKPNHHQAAAAAAANHNSNSNSDDQQATNDERKTKKQQQQQQPNRLLVAESAGKQPSGAGNGASRPVVTVASSASASEPVVNVNVKETVQVFNQIAALREKSKPASPTSNQQQQQRPLSDGSAASSNSHASTASSSLLFSSATTANKQPGGGGKQTEASLETGPGAFFKQRSIRASLAPKFSQAGGGGGGQPPSTGDQKSGTRGAVAPTAAADSSASCSSGSSSSADATKQQHHTNQRGNHSTSSSSSAAAAAAAAGRHALKSTSGSSNRSSASSDPTGGLLQHQHQSSKHNHSSQAAAAAAGQLESQAGAIPAGQQQQQHRSSSKSQARNQRTSSSSQQHQLDQITTNESYVSVLNHCFDDIEKFIIKLQQAMAASRELQAKRKLSKRSSGAGISAPEGQAAAAAELSLLSARARGPNEDDYFEILSKFKLAFNLLAKLKGCIHEPNAPELVHFLFTPLAIIIESARNTKPAIDPTLVGIPYLNQDALDLLSNCCTSKEYDMWMSLGPNWTQTIDTNLLKAARLPSSFQPIFSDGWAPIIGELELIGLVAPPPPLPPLDGYGGLERLAHNGDEPGGPGEAQAQAAAGRHRHRHSSKHDGRRANSSAYLAGPDSTGAGAGTGYSHEPGARHSSYGAPRGAARNGAAPLSRQLSEPVVPGAPGHHHHHSHYHDGPAALVSPYSPYADPTEVIASPHGSGGGGGNYRSSREIYRQQPQLQLQHQHSGRNRSESVEGRAMRAAPAPAGHSKLNSKERLRAAGNYSPGQQLLGPSQYSSSRAPRMVNSQGGAAELDLEHRMMMMSSPQPMLDFGADPHESPPHHYMANHEPQRYMKSAAAAAAGTSKHHHHHQQQQLNQYRADKGSRSSRGHMIYDRQAVESEQYLTAGGGNELDRDHEAMLLDLGPVQLDWLFELQSRGAMIVRVLFSRAANNDKELSVRRGEILEILDDSRKWWRARNVDLQVAHVPHTIVAVMHGYQSLDDLLANNPSELSCSDDPGQLFMPSSAQHHQHHYARRADLQQAAAIEQGADDRWLDAGRHSSSKNAGAFRYF